MHMGFARDTELIRRDTGPRPHTRLTILLYDPPSLGLHEFGRTPAPRLRVSMVSSQLVICNQSDTKPPGQAIRHRKENYATFGLKSGGEQ